MFYQRSEEAGFKTERDMCNLYTKAKWPTVIYIYGIYHNELCVAS